MTQRLIAVALLFLACVLWSQSMRLKSQIGKSPQEFLKEAFKHQ
jgi:hypothetical protein